MIQADLDAWRAIQQASVRPPYDPVAVASWLSALGINDRPRYDTKPAEAREKCHICGKRDIRDDVSETVPFDSELARFINISGRCHSVCIDQRWMRAFIPAFPYDEVKASPAIVWEGIGKQRDAVMFVMAHPDQEVIVMMVSESRRDQRYKWRVNR